MSAENNLSLGEFLRQERERKGLTIEQVASATKISVRLLHALEGDQYSELPAKPFIRGFVASYCRFVGLDSREVLTQFGSFMDTRSQDRPNREGGHSGYAFEKREGEQSSRTVLGIVMGVFVVVGAVAFIILKPSSKHHRGTHVEKLRSVHASPSPKLEASPEPSASPAVEASPTPETSASPSPAVKASPSAKPSPTPKTSPSPKPSPSPKASPSPSPSPSAKPSPSPSASAAPAASPAATPSPTPTESADDPLNNGASLKRSDIKFKLLFKAYESVWVRYQVDDRKQMKFILKKGRVLILRARTAVRIQVANPKHVSFSYDGKNYPTLDKYKNVFMRHDDATLLFPLEGAETIDNPFPGESPISKRPTPISPSPDPTVTPAQ